MDILIFVGIYLLGFGITLTFLRGGNWIEHLSLAFPLGSASLSYLLFFVGIFGLSFSISNVLVVYILTLITFTVTTFITGKPHVDNLHHVRIKIRQGLKSINYPAFFMFIFLIASLIGTGFLAIGRGYSEWDAAGTWASKGYGIAWEGTIFGAESWGAHGLTYPLNIPILIAVFQLFSGDALPASKLIFPLYYLSLLLGCYAYWRRIGVGGWYSSFGLILIGTVPIIFRHATLGYVNLPLATFLILGILWFLHGTAEKDRKHFLLSSLLFGFATWTTLEGILFSGAILGPFILYELFQSRKMISLHVWIPFLILSTIWYIFFRTYGASGSQAMSAVDKMMASIRAGDYHLVEARLIFGYTRRYIFKPEIWGLLFPVSLLAFVVNLRKLKTNPELRLILVAIVSTGFLTAGLFYLRSFEISGFLSLLQRGFPRGFLQTAILIGIGAVASTRFVGDKTKSDAC